MHRIWYVLALLVAAAIFAAPAGATLTEGEGPDLVVDWVVPNPPCEEIFANENNTYCAQITNNGTAASEPFNVTFGINQPGSAPRESMEWIFYEEVEVNGLDPGESIVICVDDECSDPLSWRIPPYGEPYVLVASLSGYGDDLLENGASAEFSGSVVYNGYKGKIWTDGYPDYYPFMAGLPETTQGYLPDPIMFRGDVAYSTGDSSPVSWEWTMQEPEQLGEVTWNWAPGDIPIPADTPILYSYLVLSYDHAAQELIPSAAPGEADAEAMPDTEFPVDTYLNVSFNDQVITPFFHSWDRQMFPEGTDGFLIEDFSGEIGPDFQNGIIIYPIGDFEMPDGAPAEGAEQGYFFFDSWFVPGEENYVTVVNEYGPVGLRGALLVVLYEDANETCKVVYIMHGDDMLCANSTLGTDETETYGFGNFIGGNGDRISAELRPESGFSRDVWATLTTFSSGADYEGSLYAVDYYYPDRSEAWPLPPVEEFRLLEQNAWRPMGESEIGVNVQTFTLYDNVPPLYAWQAKEGECFDTLGAMMIFEEPDYYMYLQPGWNYISVPGYLCEDKNTFGWLFGDLDTGNRSIWLYEGGTWTAMGGGDVIEPMYAYWVYVDEDDAFLVQENGYEVVIPLFSNRTDWSGDPPTRELVPGWNAISSSRYSSVPEIASWASIDEVLDGMDWETLIHWRNGYDNGLEYWQKGYDEQFFNYPEEEEITMDPYLLPFEGYWVKVNETGTIPALEGWGEDDPCWYCVG